MTSVPTICFVSGNRMRFLNDFSTYHHHFPGKCRSVQDSLFAAALLVLVDTRASHGAHLYMQGSFRYEASAQIRIKHQLIKMMMIILIATAGGKIHLQQLEAKFTYLLGESVFK